MTDKEVRKLKKPDLLEILFYLQKENETLRTENEKLQKQVESLMGARTLSDEDAQRIAQAVKHVLHEAGTES